ncbi:MAG TPA: DUF1634 domain-containing protein [Candidatus Omnitrophota bacterium]|jgi:uncharacterized membrane protein|nr:DUF1634 domain-containing protein [Candidatus Omnitrophota bacterium]
MADDIDGAVARPPERPESALQLWIGRVLRGGVFVAALVAVFGGLIYLRRHGAALPEYATFHGVPNGLDSVHGIIRGALQGRGRWITQLALLLLIATPVARVALSVAAFAKERDGIYAAISAFVLALLLYSFLGGSF